MMTLFAARLFCVLALPGAVVLALQPTQAAATVGLGADPRDGANAPVPPVVRHGVTDRLYLRGADLAIVNSGACALLARAERRECLEKLSGDSMPPLHRAVSPSPD